jgi:hypothetical protein
MWWMQLAFQLDPSVPSGGCNRSEIGSVPANLYDVKPVWRQDMHNELCSVHKGEGSHIVGKVDDSVSPRTR